MAQKKPIVLTAGKLEELQSGDHLAGDEDSFVATADGAITANDCVRVTATGVDTADATTSGTADETIGFATQTVTATNPVNVQTSGVLAGFSGLTAGSDYYLSTTAGTISTTVPSTAGNIVIHVGKAISATELQIKIHQRIKRG